MAMIPILNDNSPMPFGKHRGKRMEDVPAGYLLWLWEQPAQDTPGRAVVKGMTFDGALGSHIYANDRAVREYIRDNMAKLRIRNYELRNNQK